VLHSLSRHGSQENRRQKTILYSIPFIALSLFLAIYYVETVPATAAVDYTLDISIQLSYLDPNSATGAVILSVYPERVGVAGGVWKTDQYDSYGLDGRYPVFAKRLLAGTIRTSTTRFT